MRESLILVLQKAVYLLLSILLIISVAFLIFRVMPDDVVRLYAPKGIPEAMAERIVNESHLDDPLTVQYPHYVYERLTGDFDSPSVMFSRGTTISDFVYSYMQKTLFLLALVVGFSVLFGTLCGMFAAKARRNSVVDRFIPLPALVLFCIPVACIALILVDLNIGADAVFPIVGPVGRDFASMNLPEKVVDVIYHAFLPVLVGFLASVGMFTLIVRDGIRRFARDPDSLTADGMRMRARHLLVRTFHSMLPMIKLFAVWSLTVVLVVDFMFQYQGLGTLFWEAFAHRDAPLLDVTFYLTALVAIAFMFMFDLPVTLAHRRIEAGRKDTSADAPQFLPQEPVLETRPERSMLRGLIRNWAFLLALSGFCFVVVIAVIGPSLVSDRAPGFYPEDYDAFEGFLLGAGTPLLIILMLCLISGFIGLFCGALTAIVRATCHLPGRIASRGLDILSDGMIAVSLIPLVFALFFVTRGQMPGALGFIPLIVYLWYWGPVANTAKNIGQRESSSQSDSYPHEESAFWSEIASRTLFATKYVAVIGLLSVTLIEFMRVTWDLNSWGSMMGHAYASGLWMSDGWIWILLPSFGIALLAGSVYVIIGVFEKVLGARARPR